jgi:hypothetical protein
MAQAAGEPVGIATVIATDVEAAHAEAQRAKAQLDEAESRLAPIVERQRQLIRRLRQRELVQRAREICDNYTTRQGGLFILIFGACLMIMVVCHALGLPFVLWAFLFLAVAVDLIAAKTGFRVLVQVRVTSNWTVGADAVEQARSGETAHECDCCAVITNSTFAPGAVRAARAAECLLVDREQIPLLIEGKVRV